MHTVDFNAWVTVDNAEGMPAAARRRAGAAGRAGPRRRVLDGALGEPFLQVP